ncbi:hypothetical protein [Variovorax sp. V118]
MRRFLTLTFADGTGCEGFVTELAEVCILIAVSKGEWPGVRVSVEDVAA